ncbi:MAG TPA: hypothetical protein VJC18_10785, partial [bacterium]|nr:hypothetical protein [bacterium]
LAAKGFLTFYVNLYAATTKKKFIDLYARAITTGSQGHLDRVVKQLKDLLPRMIPKIIIKGDGSPEYEFDYSKKETEVSPLLEDLYGAVEKLALKRNKRAVVVFDEFQEILNYPDQEIERGMRGFIQAQKKTAYVFMGSRRHLMQLIFNDIERPFYKSGRMFPLKKIDPIEFAKFIQDSFQKGKIHLQQDFIETLLAVTDCHPYYTQMLCSVLWDRCSSKQCLNKTDIEKAIKELIEREAYTYTTIWDELSLQKRELLETLARNNNIKLYSKEFLSQLEENDINAIQRNTKALEETGLIYKDGGKWLFSDIFFQRWIISQI